MKRITILKALEKYDSNKGLGRTIFKEEPHIKELRGFSMTLKDDDLSPSSLLKLAQILVGKKTRTDTSESGKIFEELVNELGGYEALDILNAGGELTANNVFFFERHPSEAKALASSIVSYPKTIWASTMNSLYDEANKIKNPQELIAMFKDLELVLDTEDANLYLQALFLLTFCGLNSYQVTSLLKESKQVISVGHILQILAELTPALITMSNLVHILKISKPDIFIEIFKNLPPDQHSLDSLFQANDTLCHCHLAADILMNFKNAGWDHKPFLQVILSGGFNDLVLNKATSKLVDLKLKSELLQFILQTMFTHSNESLTLLEAVDTLNKEELDERFFGVAFKIPKFSNQMAAALVTLSKAQQYNNITQLYVDLHPAYALGLAQFWVQLSKTECTDQSLRAVMLKQPQCASYTAKVIELLSEYNLSSERNVRAVCSARLTNDTLFDLLDIMSKAKILDQESLEHLFPKLSFVKTLYSGARCLFDGKQLNSLNFDSLIADPVNAIALAENLGGKYSTQENDPNPGAKDFAILRRNTQTLCQGHRQGLFFPKQSLEQQESFKQQRGITPAAAQEEILIKIALNSGNQALEQEVEEHISKETYSSFSK